MEGLDILGQGGEHGTERLGPQRILCAPRSIEEPLTELARGTQHPVMADEPLDVVDERLSHAEDAHEDGRQMQRQHRDRERCRH